MRRKRVTNGAPRETTAIIDSHLAVHLDLVNQELLERGDLHDLVLDRLAAQWWVCEAFPKSLPQTKTLHFHFVLLSRAHLQSIVYT